MRVLTVLVQVASVGAINYAADDYESLFGSGGLARECVPFKCPKGKEAVPKRPLKLEAKGGCDAMSGGGMHMFNAGGQEESPVDPCCQQRQACGMICGTTQKFCDDQLTECMNDACDFAEDTEGCDQKKGVAKMMIDMDAGKCQKHSKDQAEEKRTKVLTDVYKRHSKDTADKVPGLVSKADNPKKFGTLLYKLTSKFPKMIKKVKDPQQEYWENMMKKAQEEPPPDKPKRGRKTTTTTEEEEPEDVEDLDAEL
ncbi:hypothetical protein SO694_00133019 [Aureococcus anophagefferens]|uniref:Uncharacterized protein n=1 Tax=Aureococcus anophagefferens TaxID=44056 RepID=A0ABR1GG20_AURAN